MFNLNKRGNSEIQLSLKKFGLDISMGRSRIIFLFHLLIKEKVQVINAVSEKMNHNPYFRHLTPCVVVVNGFFEFFEKIPYRISSYRNNFSDKYFPNEVQDFPSNLLFLAGLCRNDNVVICTKESTKEIESVHHRMPVILSGKDQLESWLSNKVLESSITQKKFSGLEIIKLASFVSKTSEKSVKCLMTFEEYTHTHGMNKFYQKSSKKLNTKVDKEKSLHSSSHEILKYQNLSKVIKTWILLISYQLIFRVQERKFKKRM
jgi:putative SOS response-associated peptidase YedK